MSDPSAAKKRHFSMLRDFSLPDFITIANGMLGMGAVLSCMRYLVSNELWALRLAFTLLPLAMVCDVLDGRIARWRHKASLLGQELDSLADLISFGVAPASVGFACGLQGGWDAIIFVFFVSCGLSRLARYNVTASQLADNTGKVKYFEGTPIPTSLALVAVLAVLTHFDRIGAALPFGAMTFGFELHPLALMYLVSGSLMVSKTLRIPKP